MMGNTASSSAAIATPKNVAVDTLMSMIDGEYDGLKDEYILPVEFASKRLRTVSPLDSI